MTCIDNGLSDETLMAGVLNYRGVIVLRYDHNCECQSSKYACCLENNDSVIPLTL